MLIQSSLSYFIDMNNSYRLECIYCGSKVAHNKIYLGCKECDGILEYVFDYNYLKSAEFKGPIRFWRYRSVMPGVAEPITLGEGARARDLS